MGDVGTCVPGGCRVASEFRLVCRCHRFEEKWWTATIGGLQFRPSLSAIRGISREDEDGFAP